MTQTKHNLQKLQRTDTDIPSALIGFDGFVDEVVHVVGRRTDSAHYQRLCYMKEYRNKINEAAGLNMNIEMVPISRKLGGNGPILANSLLQLGVPVTYIGALGKNTIHPVFRELKEKADVISVCKPGYTDAIEFYDGKIISSKLENLKDVNWDVLKGLISPEKLALHIRNTFPLSWA